MGQDLSDKESKVSLVQRLLLSPLVTKKKEKSSHMPSITSFRQCKQIRNMPFPLLKKCISL